MPELPEVETTLRGIAPALQDQKIEAVVVRNPSLRWPVPKTVQQAAGRTVVGLQRRAKYMLIDVGAGGLLCHLGMSGSLRICDPDSPPRKHDHFDIVMSNGHCVRYHDPRRFGALLWWNPPGSEHPLLANLGREPARPSPCTARHPWKRS